MEFHQSSYKSHQQIKHESGLVETWKNKNTVDYWRHHRMYSQLDSLLTTYPNATWLTVGDGRYGTDAHYIREAGRQALASDINESSLKKAKAADFISDYAVENAEHLSFRDNHFDFVLCKEAYHHFPRPAIALYEMLRVAKTGVVLIEPNDINILESYSVGSQSAAYWLMFSLKQWVKKKLGKPAATLANRYETSGNYVYTISKHELEKAALGLNLEALATKGMNDFYLEGVEFEKTEDNGPLFREVKNKIEELNNLSSRRPETYGLLVAIIFKKLPTAECFASLQKNQFDFKKLEKNPYIKD